MPDVFVCNIPSDTSQEDLIKFYNKVVEVISGQTGVDPTWVHPFFPASMLHKNLDKLINAIVIINGLEDEVNGDEVARKVVYALGALIQETFVGAQAAVKVINQKIEWQHFFEARSDLEGKGETLSMPKPK